jgi:hypothetical protein
LSRALGICFPSSFVLIATLGFLGCTTTTPTTLSQTTDGTTRALPRTGDILQIAPDKIEGEAVVDVPGAPGQPSLRIVTGTVNLDLTAQGAGFILGPPTWAEVLIRFSLTPKSPLRGTLTSANGIAMPAAFDAPGFNDSSSRIGFGVKSVTIEQLPSGEVIFFVRVAVRGLMDTKLIRIAYQANLLWTPGALPGGQTPVAPAPVAPTPVTPGPVPTVPPQ